MKGGCFFMNIEEMKQHEWSISWSGGKDSTATVIFYYAKMTL